MRLPMATVASKKVSLFRPETGAKNQDPIATCSAGRIAVSEKRRDLPIRFGVAIDGREIALAGRARRAVGPSRDVHRALDADVSCIRVHVLSTNMTPYLHTIKHFSGRNTTNIEYRMVFKVFVDGCSTSRVESRSADGWVSLLPERFYCFRHA